MVQTVMMLAGLALAACGHVLLRDCPRTVMFWERLDALFSPGFPTPAPAAGGVLLATGTSLVLTGMAGA